MYPSIYLFQRLPRTNRHITWYEKCAIQMIYGNSGLHFKCGTRSRWINNVIASHSEAIDMHFRHWVSEVLTSGDISLPTIDMHFRHWVSEVLTSGDISLPTIDMHFRHWVSEVLTSGDISLPTIDMHFRHWVSEVLTSGDISLPTIDMHFRHWVSEVLTSGDISFPNIAICLVINLSKHVQSCYGWLKMIDTGLSLWNFKCLHVTLGWFWRMSTLNIP